MKIKLKLSSRVFIINGVAFAVILGIGILIFLQFQRGSRDVQDLSLYTNALRIQEYIDSSLQELTLDVYRAKFAAEDKNESRKDEILQHADSTAVKIRKYLDENRRQLQSEKEILPLLDNCV